MGWGTSGGSGGMAFHSGACVCVYVYVRVYVCVCVRVRACVRCCTHALVEPVRLPSQLGRQVLSGKKGSRGTRHASLSS